MLLISINSRGQRSVFFELAKSAETKEDYLEAVRLMKLSYDMDYIKDDNDEECLDELAMITYYFSKLEQPDSVRAYAQKGWKLVTKLSEHSPESSIIYGQNIVISLYNALCDNEAISLGTELITLVDKYPDISITKDDWRNFVCGIGNSTINIMPEILLLEERLQEYLNKDDLKSAYDIVEQIKHWTNNGNLSNYDRVPAWLSLALYYMRTGDNEQAKFLVKISWESINQAGKEPTFEQIMSRINIEKELPIDPDWLIATTDSLLHSELFANRWSKRFSEQALADRAYLLEACGWGYDHKGEIEKAKEYIIEALEYKRTTNRLNKLGTLSLTLQDYKTATNCFKEIIDSLGIDNVRDDVLSNLCASYWLDGNKQELENILPSYFIRRKNKVIDCFGFMTAEERDMYVSSNPVGGWFETALATGFSSSGQQWSTGNELAYNLAIWRKGLLLEANRDSQRILNSLQNETKQIIQEYFRLRYQYINNTISVDSVSRYWSVERKLMKYIEQDSTYLSSLRCSWKNIQSNLPTDGIAIEFVETIIPNKSDLVSSNKGLGVLLVRPQDDYPIYVFLGLNEDLLTLTPLDEEGDAAFDLLYEGDNVKQAYKSIWLPFEPYLNNVKKVYYSPDGIIHNINLDYIQDLDGNELCDMYDLIRVSSTRQLLNKNQDSLYNKHDALFGDIIYAPGQTIAHNRTRASLRSGFSLLDGTLKEVTEIDSILKDAQFISAIHLRDDATEENFRKLSGRSPEIIHVATHGFYYSADKAAIENTYIGSLSQFSGMYRSGLAFKDAQIKWNTPSYKFNSLINPTDGILLSQELSSLDLSNTRLAVLSACQTANGSNDYDGLIGLQRGFKLAGVETLMMSLWPVDDEATQLLMVSFYRNYSKGDSAQDALHKAQNYVRHIARFEKPVYWAGWILLDALN